MSAPHRVIASIFSLSAFAVATLSGLAAGATATDTLLRAIPAMIVFHLVGGVVGWSMESMIRRVASAQGGHPGDGGKPVENSGAPVKDSA